jgi:hypothetical protein
MPEWHSFVVPSCSGIVLALVAAMLGTDAVT